MESFYVPPHQIKESHLTIRDEEHHHITRVLRMQPGDEVLVVDGKGTAYFCRIASISIRETECVVESMITAYNEPAVRVTLMLPILKNRSRMEWLIEKGTELGVTVFLPIITSRTIPERIRLDRLEKIAAAAMKQCKRSVLPRIQEEKDLEYILRNEINEYDAVYIGDEGRTDIIRLGKENVNLPGKNILLLAGPEGGFTEEETALSIDCGAVPVSLGKRRLRAETAALVMAAYSITD
jgi:16S rRNA (uracil1498-N3)-methyltransferase